MLVGSRNLERGEEAAKTIEGDARAIQLDVTDRASIDSAAERVRTEWGRLDVLVNNAGAFALDREPSGIKVNAAAPGFTATAMNSFEGRRTVEEAAREPVRLALLGPEGPTGTFSDESGPIPW